MSYVVVNVVSVPPHAREGLEARFAGRAGSVDKAPGFERFELLRPEEGTDSYLVYTRWRSREDYRAWVESDAFRQGHRGGPSSGATPPAPPTVWEFDVAQSSG